MSLFWVLGGSGSKSGNGELWEQTPEPTTSYTTKIPEFLRGYGLPRFYSCFEKHCKKSDGVETLIYVFCVDGK